MTDKALTNWEERMAAEASAAVLVERPSLAAITFSAGQMSYGGNAVADNTLDCVILGSIIEQAYYPGAYDPDNIVPPACFAFGTPGSEGSMQPHVDVPADQRGGDDCETCENYQWGSGSGRGKACKTRRRLAIIPANALKDPESIAAAEIAKMTISVTNVKQFTNHVNATAATYQRPTWGVISRITTKPDARTQFKIIFSVTEAIDLATLPMLEPLLDRADSVLRAPFDMVPRQQEEDTAPAKKKKY